MMEINKIYCMDCIAGMKQLEDNSVDSIVTDPPYGLGFMGKEWDTYDKSQFGLKGTEGENDLKVKKNFKALPRYRSDNSFYEFSLAWAKEAYRVLKPGGYLLSFGGTRTYHRMACAIEDAGFEIRDQIQWIYGSGFPKSLNIGKAIDKLQGNEREIIGYKEPFGRENRNTKPTGNYNAGIGNNYTNEKDLRPIYKETSEWEGWGTALKPANEPICVARKPLSEKTVAENVLKWGTGGINIDDCRISFNNKDIPKAGNRTATFGTQETISGGNGSGGFEANNLGRFPANVIHDGSDEVLDLLGEPSRFFYCAKASKSERNAGLDGFEETNVNDGRVTSIDNPYQRGDTLRKNTHPTVKPIKLMEYLVKLVTPKGGVCLDPFMGSGTTGMAAKSQGFDYIGFDMTEEYCKIAEARIANVVKQEKI